MSQTRLRVTLTVSNNPYQAEIHQVVQARDVTLTVNTNPMTPLKPKSIKPFRLQGVPNNYTYIHTYIHIYIHTLAKHNPPSGAVGPRPTSHEVANILINV
uniref:SFRICE_014477 n=1 Tax=Spodoptera frugiperda TaxID=7108 RepID=A0A2H1W7U8_SPOFR